MARKDDDDKTLTADDKFELLLAALAAKPAGGLSKDDLREILASTAQVSAESMKKAIHRENDAHPGISALSYPEGDVARPRQAPPFEFLYLGYPCHKFLETQHWRECELMAQVEPGEYTVIRKDGSRMAVTVTGERDADGRLTKVEVTFPVTREDKGVIPPQAVVLYQIVHAKTKTPKQAFVEAMSEHLNQVLGETVTA